jgi:putative transposase
MHATMVDHLRNAAWGEGNVPSAKRRRIEPTDDWQRLQSLVGSPEQERYELLRPIVLFGHTPAERAERTGVAERTLHRRAAAFDRAGMASLFAADDHSPADRRSVPEHIRRAIGELKAEYAALGPFEIAAVCRRRFDDCHVNYHTVQRVLAAAPPPPRAARRFPPYHQIADAFERRRAIVQLFFEGWNITSIAGYLETNRPRVYEVIRRFLEQGWRGLEERSRAPKAPAKKADLKAMAAIRRLQANPELGEFRVHAALQQMGITLSPRTCGRILAEHRSLYRLAGPAAGAPHDPKAMPFQANHRHQYWSVDVRYLDTPAFNGGQVYVLSVLENYSRALLATMLSLRQDLVAYLIVLHAAMRRHGAPEALVSDSGAIFKAKSALATYAALGVDKRQIGRGRPWQNYIETHFNTLRRMADHAFATATTWEELQEILERFSADYNAQEHFAHRERADGKRSPEAVLGWVRGAWCDEAALSRLFRVRYDRRLDAAGYARFRHWRLYGERGLMRQHIAIWLAPDALTLAYEEEPLAHYRVTYEPDGRHLRTVTEPRLFRTRHRSPQLPLWPPRDDEWRQAVRVPPYASRRQRPVSALQPPLFPNEEERAASE